MDSNLFIEQKQKWQIINPRPNNDIAGHLKTSWSGLKEEIRFAFEKAVTNDSSQVYSIKQPHPQQVIDLVCCD